MRHLTLTSLLSSLLIASGCTINIVPASHTVPEPADVTPKPAYESSITRTYQSNYNVSRTSLYMLVVRGDRSAAAYALQQGANPNAYGNDPVHGQRTPLCVAVRNRDYTMTRMLLNAGADPNIDCHYHGTRETPLLAASMLGYSTLTQYLITHGANPNYRSPAGLTPYGAAVHGGHKHIINSLANAGAQPANPGQRAISAHRPAKHDKHDNRAKPTPAPQASSTGRENASSQSRLNRTEDATHQPPGLTRKPARPATNNASTQAQPHHETPPNSGHASKPQLVTPGWVKSQASQRKPAARPRPAPAVDTETPAKEEAADEAKATYQATRAEKNKGKGKGKPAGTTPAITSINSNVTAEQAIENIENNALQGNGKKQGTNPSSRRWGL